MKIKIGITFIIAIVLVGCARKQMVTEPQHIAWMTDINAGLAKAAEQNKSMIVDFMAIWCPPCQRMEDSTFSDVRIIEKAKSFIPVRIDVDEQGDVANAYNGNAGKYGGVGIPNLLFMDAEGNRLKHIIGFQSADALLAVMDSLLSVKTGE